MAMVSNKDDNLQLGGDEEEQQVDDEGDDEVADATMTNTNSNVQGFSLPFLLKVL
jgi:hypothetical protein